MYNNPKHSNAVFHKSKAGCAPPEAFEVAEVRTRISQSASHRRKIKAEI